MRALVRSAALVLVSLAGLASLLATSPPPPPGVLLSVEPATVCAGDDVTLQWQVWDGSDQSAPSDLRLATAPIDAFDPPIEGTPIADEGSLVVQPLLPAHISVDTATFVSVPDLPRIEAMPCDLTGVQLSAYWATWALAGDDGDGSLLAAFGLVSGGETTTIAKLDASLEPLWEDTTGGRLVAVAPSASGDVVAVGSAVTVVDGAPPPGPRLAVVRRYDAVGDVVWTSVLGDGDVDAPATDALAVAWLGDDVVVVGRSQGSGEPSEGFVMRVDAAGDVVWLRHIAADDGGYVRSTGVRVGSDGHLYVGGVTNGEVGGAPVAAVDAFLVMFDVDGERLPWSSQVAGSDVAGAVALGFGNTVVLVGTSLVTWPLGGGEPVWSAPAPPNATWRSVTEGEAGTLLVAGRASVDVDLPSAWNLMHDDVVVQQLAGDGSVLGEHRFGSLSDERLEAVAAWPTARPGVAAIGGWTRGDFLMPRETGHEAFVLEVPLE